MCFSYRFVSVSYVCACFLMCVYVSHVLCLFLRCCMIGVRVCMRCFCGSCILFNCVCILVAFQIDFVGLSYVCVRLSYVCVCVCLMRWYAFFSYARV